MTKASILLHICCAPCTVYPAKLLRDQRFAVTGFFYNPNIHPYVEFRKRLQTLKEYSGPACLPVICHESYEMRLFLRLVVGHEDERCGLCYELRLKEAAAMARKAAFDAFTTTLLYSRFQRHELIRQMGERIGREYGIPFYYHDFRLGWAEGCAESRALNLYRQPYCGCIYSEQERYDPAFVRQRRRAGKENKDMVSQGNLPAVAAEGGLGAGDGTPNIVSVKAGL